MEAPLALVFIPVRLVLAWTQLSACVRTAPGPPQWKCLQLRGCLHSGLVRHSTCF